LTCAEAFSEVDVGAGPTVTVAFELVEPVTIEPVPGAKVALSVALPAAKVVWQVTVALWLLDAIGWFAQPPIAALAALNVIEPDGDPSPELEVMVATRVTVWFVTGFDGATRLVELVAVTTAV
jgi:hypothetical protein